MTATAQPLAPAGPNRTAPDSRAGQRLLLHDVSWQAYQAIGNALRDRPSLRLTYDRGTLELMTTSTEHERYKKRLSRFVETLAEEFNLPLETAGNMTFQREDIERGLEADDCFWIGHEHLVRGKLTWDPKMDPPPDLVLEVDISRPATDRMSLYAQLGVSEVWRFDGTTLQVYLLQPDGTYQLSERSPTFPAVPLTEAVRFLQPSEDSDYLGQIRDLRRWLQSLNRPA